VGRFVLPILLAGAARAQAPAAPAAIDVQASQPAVAVQLSGGIDAFGVTPFQLRDMPSGDYLLHVSHGAYEGGSSRLRVRTTPEGTRFEVGSVRGPLLMRSALLPGLGHLQSGAPYRGGSAMAQTLMSAALTWTAHRDYRDAADREAQAALAYYAERDAENLASRRSAYQDAQLAAADARAQRWRWIGVTGWAYGTSLLDLWLDSRPVAQIVSTPEGTRSLQVRARPTSRSLAVLRATLHPGSGHYALNRRWRGLTFEALSSIGVWASLYQIAETETAERTFSGARTAYSAAGEDELDASRAAMLAAHSDWSEQRDRRNVALIATGAVWALNLIDVLWSEPVQQQPDFGVPRRLGAALRTGPDGVGAGLTARF
jgi:hypothetical protein